MSFDRKQARDEIIAKFRTFWLASSFAAVPLYYDDLDADSPDAVKVGSTVKSWVRLSVRHDMRAQSAFSDTTTKRYTTLGAVTLQIFTPRGDGLSRADDLGIVAQDAFAGLDTPGGVVFMNVQTREVGPSGTWYQTQVTADFSYDEVR